MYFKSGWWYRLKPEGYDMQGWNTLGEMDFMKDGKWHECKWGAKDDASFYDSPDPNYRWIWKGGTDVWDESEHNPNSILDSLGNEIKPGDMVRVSDTSIDLCIDKREFIAFAPKAREPYATYSESYHEVVSWMYCVKVGVKETITIEEAEKRLNVRIKR